MMAWAGPRVYGERTIVEWERTSCPKVRSKPECAAVKSAD